MLCNADNERNYLVMTARDKEVFRSVVSICNIEAFNDATKTATDWFLTWDILEDAMPFLAQPTIEVDIQWTQNDLKRKVQELGLEKNPTAQGDSYPLCGIRQTI